MRFTDTSVTFNATQPLKRDFGRDLPICEHKMHPKKHSLTGSFKEAFQGMTTTVKKVSVKRVAKLFGLSRGQ